jgi:hypothetical protein
VLELERITFIYWPIEHTLKASFVMVLELGKIAFIYWPIECTPKV